MKELMEKLRYCLTFNIKPPPIWKCTRANETNYVQPPLCT